MNEAYPDAVSHERRPHLLAHGGVQTLWRRDGWNDYFPVTINTDGPNPGLFTRSVTGDMGIVTGPAATGNGNGRMWLLNRNAFYEDSEIESTWEGPSQLDGNASPQIGHVHRAVQISPGVWSGYVVTNNIAFGGFSTINANVWQINPADVTTPLIGANGLGKVYGAAIDRALLITYVRRFTFGPWFNVYGTHRSDGFGMAAGDIVTIDAVSDNTFDATNVSVNGFTYGEVQITSPSATGAVSQKIESGSITPQEHKRWFPLKVRSQLRGTTLRVKVWRTTDEEPPWSNAVSVGIFNDLVPGNGITLPTGRGFGGLAFCHLRAGANTKVSDVTYTPL